MLQTACEPLLPKGIAEIRDRLLDAPRLALFLDFDGTLAPIVDDPVEARLDASTREILEALSYRDEILLAIVSGRPVSDLRIRVGIEKAIYAGNHGLEIAGPGLHFIDPAAAASREPLAVLSKNLAGNLHGIPGVHVEYKGLSISVHYRRASAAAVLDVERIVRAATASAASPFRREMGKRVLDVLPRTAWNKGAAAAWIVNSHTAGGPWLPVYLGDDRSDEDAFNLLRDGVTIHVGDPPGATCARYYVADPAQVRAFLAWLERRR